MTREARITVASRMDQLATVAESAHRFAEPIVGAEAAALVNMAVTELCSNVVRHGHPDDLHHEYMVCLRQLADAIEIEIHDVGPEFASTAPVMPSVDVSPEDLPEGGFGMALIATTMDEFEQRREAGVNITRIVKRRP
jgi:serine/threonine-protein kinase RsbW